MNYSYVGAWKFFFGLLVLGAFLLLGLFMTNNHLQASEEYTLEEKEFFNEFTMEIWYSARVNFPIMALILFITFVFYNANKSAGFTSEVNKE